MSAKGSEIRTKIRLLADAHESEDVEYHIGKVLSVNNDITSNLYNTCRVELITNRGIKVSAESPMYFAKTDFNGKTINEGQKHATQAQYVNGTILQNVSLSVNNGDNQSVSIPAIGSEVVVFSSRYQQPFVAQYSNISYAKTIYKDATVYEGQTGLGHNGFQWQILNGVNDKHFVSFAPTSDTEGEFIASAETVKLQTGIDNDSVIAISKGSNILITKGSITLGQFLLNVINTMVNIANTPIPPSGGIISTINVDILPALTQLQTDINNFLQ